jgi:hypothetical protein
VNGRTVGWAVSLGTLLAGATFAAVIRSLSDENRHRAIDSAQLLHDRTVASVAQLRERSAETAQDLREQWIDTALEVRDRWTSTAEDVRARAVDTAEDWRERSSENFERRLRQAAEARDESLADLDDDEDADDRPADAVEAPEEDTLRGSSASAPPTGD